MERSEYDVCPMDFQTRMLEGRDAAIHRDLSLLGGRVTYKIPKASIRWTVQHAASFLGVSTARVKLLCSAGRLLGACRSRSGKGRPWVIPAHRQADGTYEATVLDARKGPKLLIRLL